VISASANRYKWSVQYLDGEIEDGLCATCVRYFIPYAVGEAIETRVSLTDSEFDDNYADNNDDIRYVPGVIATANIANNQYSIKLLDGTLLTDVAISDMRRYYLIDHAIPVHARVDARFPNADGWFSGRVTKANDDGETYAVQYDDGDFLPAVPHNEIRLATNHDDEEEN
jgi:hypothetical protein